ncbi:MAG TPA: hypothetical protein VNZ94_00355 [Xanthobacteraceae bacterium]|nr:hypothetical protein [Xanthobacteraceae bacterium]
MAVSAQCSSSTTFDLSRSQQRENAIQHFYAAERRAGVDPETAFDRARQYGKRLFVQDRASGCTTLFTNLGEVR